MACLSIPGLMLVSSLSRSATLLSLFFCTNSVCTMECLVVPCLPAGYISPEGHTCVFPFH